MAAVTLLGTPQVDTNTGTHTITATPAVADLIVVVGQYRGTGDMDAVKCSDNNSDARGSYDRVVRQIGPTNGDITVWVRKQFVNSATSTVFTLTGPGSTGGGIVVFKVTGMARSGWAAVRCYGGGTGAAAASPAVQLTYGPALTANAMIGGVYNETNPAGVTPPASWTEDPTPDLGYITPTTGFETARRGSGETGSTITWGSTSATIWSAVAIELDISAALFRDPFAFEPIPFMTGIGRSL